MGQHTDGSAYKDVANRINEMERESVFSCEYPVQTKRKGSERPVGFVAGLVFQALSPKVICENILESGKDRPFRCDIIVLPYCRSIIINKLPI